MKAKKQLLYKIIIALFLLILAPLLSAQNSTETQSIRLVWAGDDYAFYYEVLIDREEEGRYRNVFQEIVDVLFIEVSLPPGNYRFSIVPYDYLEKPGQGTQWINFKIEAAPEPLPPSLPPDLPLETANETSSNDTGKEMLNMDEMEPAVQAELYDEQLPLNEKYRIFDFYISASWMPLLPIYGDEYLFFSQKPSPAGAGIRFGAVYPGLDSIHLGLELTGSWYAFKPNSIGTKEKMYHAATASLNLLAEKPLPHSLALRFRLGGGLCILEKELSGYINAGISFLWYAGNHFFLEAGIDYNGLILIEYLSGCFRPCLGIGWQF